MERRFGWVTFNKNRCKKINRIMRSYEKLGLISDYKVTREKVSERSVLTQYNLVYVTTEEISKYLNDEICNTVYA